MWKKLTRVLLIAMVVFILVFIGIEPALIRHYGNISYFHIALYFIVLLALSALLFYESKYKKIENCHEKMQYVLSDAGYYYTARSEKEPKAFADAIIQDATECGYRVSYHKEAAELEFYAVLQHKKDLMYLVTLEETDKNDMLAYLDSALHDISAVQLQRTGNAVVLFICNHAAEEAVALSKKRTDIQTARHAWLHLAYAICEVPESKVYFLGNKADRCRWLITHFAMHCEVPVPKSYMASQLLPFQEKLTDELAQADEKTVLDKIHEYC